MTGVGTSRLRAALRPVAHRLRGLSARRAAAQAARGKGPLAVFLAGMERQEAALLRVYALAEALRPLGWRTLVLPHDLPLSERQAILARLSADVVVMQGVRIPMNRPDHYPGQRIILDLDDADFHLDHLAGPLAETVPKVAGVIAGSRYVARWCRGAGAVRTWVVWTGATPSARPRTPQAGRPPVMAWAQTRPMDYVAEAAQVARVARAVAVRRPGVTLRLYHRRTGDDPGFAAGFEASGLTVEWLPEMGYDDWLGSFDDAALGFCPLQHRTPFSRGKSFGKVLGYLDRKVPVIASDAADHGLFFRADTGVITNDEAAWVDRAVALLDDSAARQGMADAAHADFLTRLTTQAAAERTAAVLSEAIAQPSLEVARFDG